MTVEMGKELPVGQAVLTSGVSFDAPKHIFLMLFILTDMRRPDTFFRPYYELLPTTLNNMPIFWKEDELRLLHGSHLITQVIALLLNASCAFFRFLPFSFFFSLLFLLFSHFIFLHG